MYYFDKDIWLHDGVPVIGASGFRYPIRMAALRLQNGSVVLWSPVQMTEQVQAAVSGLGPLHSIVAPSSFHHLFVKEWAEFYPNALLFAAHGVQDKKPDLPFDAELGAEQVAGWEGDIEHVVLPGNALLSEVVFFHRPSGTVLFTDLLQNMPIGWYRGWRAVVARLDRMIGHEPAVPRKFRLTFTDRAAAREAIWRILDWPIQNVVMAHGTPVTEDARGYLQRTFKWLNI